MKIRPINFIFFLLCYLLSFFWCRLEAQIDVPETLSLQEAEQLALAHHFGIQAQRHLLNEGYYAYQESLGDWRPQVTLSKQLTANHSSYASSSLQITQTILDSQASYNVKESLQHIEELKLAVQRQMADVLLQIRQAYNQVLLAQENLRIEDSSLDLIQAELQEYEKSGEIGASLSFEITQIKLLFLKSRAAQMAAREILKASTYQLWVLLGYDPESAIPPQLKEPFNFLPAITEGKTSASCSLFSPMDILKWESYALNHRPEMQEAILQIESSRLNIRRHESENRPTLNVFAGIGQDCENFSYLSQNPYWNVGLNFNWTLFDGYKKYNRIQQGRELQAAAIQNYNQIELDTKIELRRLIAQMEEAYQSYLMAQESIKIGQEGIGLAKQKWELGTLSPFEYRDTIKTLVDIRREANQAKTALLEKYYLFLRLVGIDFIPQVQ